jgi:flagellar basal body-associated protein FliL
VPRLGELYPGICLTAEEKARKNLGKNGIIIIIIIIIIIMHIGKY